MEKRKERWTIRNLFFFKAYPYAAATLTAMLIAGFTLFYKAHRLSKAEEVVIAEHLELLTDYQTINHMELLENWEEIIRVHEKT
jgi:hypothetical protein